MQEDPGDDERIGERATTKEQSDHNMDITNLEENLYQDDMKWTINEVSDMCILEDPTIKKGMCEVLGRGGREGRAREVQADGRLHLCAQVGGCERP